MLLQVCLNGARTRDERCPALPMSPEELAAEAARAVAAGAEDIHLHPKDDDGLDSLDPRVVAQAVSAVRRAVPRGVQIGVTTGAWAAPDPEQRAALVRAWTVLPDHASVNWHEDGAELVAEGLLERGVAIEAGIYSGTDAVSRFCASPFAGRVLRILAEVTVTDPIAAQEAAIALVEQLAPARQPIPKRQPTPARQSTAEQQSAATRQLAPMQQLALARPTPVLLHGEEGGAWPVLRIAGQLGLDSRIGLEDVLTLPDSSIAADNAALVHAARSLLATSGSSGT